MFLQNFGTAHKTLNVIPLETVYIFLFHVVYLSFFIFFSGEGEGAKEGTSLF